MLTSKRSMKQKTLRGVSLVELVMAIALLSIVMTGMSLFFVRVWQTQSFTLRVGQVSLAASKGVESVIDLIRNARTGADGSFPVVTATETEFSFFADRDQDGTIERIHLFYDAGSTPKQLKYGIRNPTSGTPPTYSSGDESVSTLATFVVNTSSEPIFTYYDRDNILLSASPTVSDIRMVNVSIRVNSDPSSGFDAIEFSSFGSLRNLWGK